MNKFIILAGALAMLALGCKKKNTAPVAPSLSFVGMDRQEVRAGNIKDTVYVQLSFVDGDGDISGNRGASLYAIDNRDSSVVPIAFPDDIAVPPNQVAKGNIYTFFPAQFLLNRTDTAHKFRDTVIYKIYMRDEAGHESNRVEMLPIYLNQ